MSTRDLRRDDPLPIGISDVSFRRASPEDRVLGLLGWVEATINYKFRVAGIAVRRTLHGERRLSFPSRIDGADIRRHFLRPIDDESRRDIERMVFAQLREQDIEP